MRRRLSLTEMVALTTPLLLVLLRVSSGTTSITHWRTAVRTVLTRPVTPSVAPHRVPPRVIERIVVRTVPTSPTRVSATGTNAPSSSNGNVASATPAVLTARHSIAPMSGVLADPFYEVDEPVPAGSHWTLSANAPATWIVVCDGVTLANEPSPVVIPTTGSCTANITATTSATTTWKLEPVA